MLYSREKNSSFKFIKKFFAKEKLISKFRNESLRLSLLKLWTNISLLISIFQISFDKF